MNLGILLRSHRKKKGLTLKVVAERAGVSEGFLSQVENCVKSPSVDTLMVICDAMGVEAGALLTQLKKQDRLFVIHRQEWEEVDLPHTGFATRRFCPPEARANIDSALLFMEPGSSLPVRKNIKNGQEILCMLQGSITLEYGEQTMILNQGDSVHLWCDIHQQSVTNNGHQRAVVLWVGTM